MRPNALIKNPYTLMTYNSLQGMYFHNCFVTWPPYKYKKDKANHSAKIPYKLKILNNETSWL